MLKITVQVDGMMCGMCEAHVNDAVRKAFSVKKVTSSHCQRQFEFVRKRRRDFVIFRRRGVTESVTSLLEKSVHDLLFLAHKFFRTCIHSRNRRMAEGFSRQARQIFAGIIVFISRKFNAAWREKTRPDSESRL